MMLSTYSSLFHLRHHGADSLNGFYYQILVSVYKALELSMDTDFDMTLEGLDDIDISDNLENVRTVTKSQYIQVKYRKEGLKYNELLTIVKSFAETYRVDKSRSFLIVTNIEVAKLVQDFFQNRKDRIKIIKKIKESQKTNGLSNEECDIFLDTITLEVVKPDQLVDKCVSLITSKFIGSELASDLIIKRLIADLTQKASQRETISTEFIGNACSQVLETISSQEYNAVGSGLIERINWNNGGDALHFYQGKNPLPGDINHDYDYKRTLWLKSIEEGFLRSKTVVIKAVSGQGKTSLMYRYAKDYDQEGTIFVINQVKDESEVSRITQYLEVRSRLGIPLLVLIDDVKHNKNMWAKLVSRCLHSDVRFLVTVKEDNWLRYSAESDINVDIVSLYLDETEAKEIFSLFLKQKLVNRLDITASDYYNKLGNNKLLLEFIYLITQGVMLKDRLTDQLRELDQLKNSEKVKKILRCVCMSGVAGVELSILQVKTITDCDIEEAMSCIINEYVAVESGYIKGIHEIRSKYIVEIMHNAYITYSDTAQGILPVLSSDQVTPFIYMLITQDYVSFDCFLNNFYDLYKDFPIEKVNAVIEAVYRTGTDNYVLSNMPMINEANNLRGYVAVTMMAYELFLQVMGDTSESLMSSFQDQGAYPELKRIMSKEVQCESGIDYVRKFISRIDIKYSRDDYYNLGVFFEWAGNCSSRCANWLDVRKEFVFLIDFDHTDFDSISSLTYGLYKYDSDIYYRLIDLNKTDLLDYLRYQLECIKIELASAEITLYFMTMLSDFGGMDKTNQAVPRIDRIHKIFPYLEKYNTIPDEEILPGLTPNYFNNRKAMLPKYIIHRMSTFRSRVFVATFIKVALPNTSKPVEDYWIDLRETSLQIITASNDILNQTRKKYKHEIGSKLDSKLDPKYLKILELMNHVPYVMIHDYDRNILGCKLASLLFNKDLNRWSMYLFNFYNQIIDALSQPDSYMKLCLHNLKEANTILPTIQQFFWDMYYMTSRREEEYRLSKNETREYEILFTNLSLRFIRKIDILSDNPQETAAKLDEKDTVEIINQVRSHVKLGNVTIIESLYKDQSLSFGIILYECNEPKTYIDDALSVYESLSSYQDSKPDGFWLIPTYQMKRFVNEGFLFYTSSIRTTNGVNQSNWESFIPRDIPSNALPLIEMISDFVELPDFATSTEAEAVQYKQLFIDYQSSKVEALSENSRYDKMLKEKYQKKIIEMQEELDNYNVSDNCNNASYDSV